MGLTKSGAEILVIKTYPFLAGYLVTYFLKQILVLIWAD
jgi:hypothetical protein